MVFTKTEFWLPLACFVVVSMLSAIGWMLTGDVFSFGDLKAALFWLVIYSPVLAFFLSLLKKIVLRLSNPITSFVITGLLGLIFGFLVTYFNMIFLGAWFGSWSFPPLFAWSMGSLCAFTLKTYFVRRTVLPALLGSLVPGTCLLLFAFVFSIPPEATTFVMHEGMDIQDVQEAIDKGTEPFLIRVGGIGTGGNVGGVRLTINYKNFTSKADKKLIEDFFLSSKIAKEIVPEEVMKQEQLDFERKWKEIENNPNAVKQEISR